jgi:hypothetical protein
MNAVDGAQTSAPGRKLVSLAVDLALLVGIVVLPRLVPGMWAAVRDFDTTIYPAGGSLFDSLGPFLLGSFLSFVLWIALLVRAVRLLAKPGLGRKFLNVALVVAAPMLSLKTCEPGAVTYLRGFEHWARANVELAAIRNWQATLRPPFGEIAESQWPPCIVRLHPVYVYVDPAEKSTTLTWGGGFGHWGIVVGRPTLPMPPPPQPGYNRLLEPGAYVWHEYQ